MSLCGIRWNPSNINTAAVADIAADSHSKSSTIAQLCVCVWKREKELLPYFSFPPGLLLLGHFEGELGRIHILCDVIVLAFS